MGGSKYPKHLGLGPGLGWLKDNEVLIWWMGLGLRY